MMSTRRSAASSSRTVTQLNNGHTTSAPMSLASSPPFTRRPPQPAVAAALGPGQGLSEAGAYARAMTSTLTRSESAQTMTATLYSPDTLEKSRNRPDRPLPRPPGQFADSTSPSRRVPSSGSQQAHALHTISTEMPIRPAQDLPGVPPTLSPTKASARPQPGLTQSASKDLTNSAPRRQARRSDSKGPDVYSNASVSQTQVSLHPPRQAGTDALKPPSSSRRRASVLQRPSGRLQLDFLLAHPAIQSSLLGAIGINTFLSLSGSSENVRRQFTGESVGRWVLREWTVLSPDQAGNRWPNLTVWEGFRTYAPRLGPDALADHQWNHYCTIQQPTAPIQPGGTIFFGTFRSHIRWLYSIYEVYRTPAIPITPCYLSRTTDRAEPPSLSLHLRLV